MEEEQQDNNVDRQFVRRMELYEDDDEAPCIICCHCDLSCPCGWRYSFSLLLKYFLLIPFTCFNIVVPSIMIYIGINYSYCDDMFSPWLIFGGIIVYADCLLFVFWRCLIKKRRVYDIHYTVCDFPCIRVALSTFVGVSVMFFTWWLFGFARIFSGSMLDDRVTMMEDPVCRLYLYKFPFWLSVFPFIFLFIGIFGALSYFMIKP